MMGYIATVFMVSFIIFLCSKISERPSSQKEDFYYTPELDVALENVQQIREQLHRLERLQTEIDISKRQNCYGRSLNINWGNREDDDYTLQLVGDESTDNISEIESIINKERIRLTASLEAEIEKIAVPMKSKGKSKQNYCERGGVFLEKN